MSTTNLPKLSAQAMLWLVGALVCTGYYWLRTQPFPRRTEVGVERRLFGLGTETPTMEERPGGGPILVFNLWDDPAPSAPAPQQPGEWPGWLYEHARARLTSDPRGARPALTPWPLQGTWMLDGDRLRYRWRLMSVWLNDRYLQGENYDARLGPQGGWLLDVVTGRTYRGPAADFRRARIEDQDERELRSYGVEAGPDPVSPALDDLDPKAASPGVSHFLEGRETVLRWAGDGDVSADLTAAATAEPSRSRVLSPRSALAAATRDGRRLYVLKADGLWRLDLRKPVRELLQEVTVPELPLEGIGR